MNKKCCKKGVDYIGVGCGALIVNDKSEVLLMQRGPKAKNEVGFWAQPGGTVEFGETIKGAIIREIKEELDIDIELFELLSITDHIMPDENQHWVAASYKAKIISGEPKIMEPEKISDLRWFPLNEIPEKLSLTTVNSIDGLKEI
ncbi:NUDIX domain-containing protein [bacterium]|nr:NUDIX domain-containing protein [bacterium]